MCSFVEKNYCSSLLLKCSLPCTTLHPISTKDIHVPTNHLYSLLINFVIQGQGFIIVEYYLLSYIFFYFTSEWDHFLFVLLPLVYFAYRIPSNLLKWPQIAWLYIYLQISKGSLCTYISTSLSIHLLWKFGLFQYTGKCTKCCNKYWDTYIFKSIIWYFGGRC